MNIPECDEDHDGHSKGGGGDAVAHSVDGFDGCQVGMLKWKENKGIDRMNLITEKYWIAVTRQTQNIEPFERCCTRGGFGGNVELSPAK